MPIGRSSRRGFEWYPAGSFGARWASSASVASLAEIEGSVETSILPHCSTPRRIRLPWLIVAATLAPRTGTPFT